MAITQQDLDHFARTWCLPLMLLLNFACCQYLVLLFRSRIRELRVLLLLTIAAIGFVALIPFATQDEATVGRMNDVSESCLALLLLVQTALVGSKHSKGPAIKTAFRGLQLIDDLLIVFDVVVVALGVVSVFKPSVSRDFGGAEVMNNVAENLTLAFTFVYRFVGQVMAKPGGWRQVVREDNWELFWHIVFATHEYLFDFVQEQTHLSYEFVQAVYMRLTILPCVWMTIGDHHEFHIVRTTLMRTFSNQKLPMETITPQKNAAKPKAHEVVDANSVKLSERSVSATDK